MNVARWIEKHAAFSPDRAAIRFRDASISYAAFQRMIEKDAGRLLATGVGAGDVVAYLGLNSPEFLSLLFACARLGAMIVPLNWRLAAPELSRVLQDCRPRLALVEAEFHATGEEVARSVSGPHWASYSDAPEGWLPWRETSPERLPSSMCDADAALLLCYTSGSTGVPKGVVHSQSSLFWNAVNSAHMHDLTSADRILTTLPIFHVGGLNILTTPALHAGASVTLHARFDPGETIEAIERDRITLTVLVPAQLTALMAHPRWASADLSSLRVITTGSTIVPAPLIKQLHERGLRIVQVYGSTETCPLAAYQRADSAERKIGSSGLPALHCDVRIVGPDGHDRPTGDDGEILVHGPNLMSGYLNAPEVTAEANEGGWYHTGDLGHFDEEGYLYVVARKSDMIISGGENVYPAEIESVLLESPKIAEVSIVGRPDPRWGEAIVAVLVPAPGAQMSADEVLALLDNRVARYKRPREIVFVDSLPRNSMGKILRARIRADLALHESPSLEGQTQ